MRDVVVAAGLNVGTPNEVIEDGTDDSPKEKEGLAAADVVFGAVEATAILPPNEKAGLGASMTIAVDAGGGLVNPNENVFVGSVAVFPTANEGGAAIGFVASTLTVLVTEGVFAGDPKMVVSFPNEKVVF